MALTDSNHNVQIWAEKNIIINNNYVYKCIDYHTMILITIMAEGKPGKRTCSLD